MILNFQKAHQVAKDYDESHDDGSATRTFHESYNAELERQAQQAVEAEQTNTLAAKELAFTRLQLFTRERSLAIEFESRCESLKAQMQATGADRLVEELERMYRMGFEHCKHLVEAQLSTHAEIVFPPKEAP